MSGADVRSGLEMLLALLASVAAWRFLPLASVDPFRATLVILPLAIAGFRGFARHAPRRHLAQRPENGQRGGLPLASLFLLALLLATLGRHGFGLAATDWFLAAGFLLLLAYHVRRTLVLWLPTLRRDSASARPHGVFFLLPFLVYLVLMPWQAEHRQVDGDEPYYLLLAHSLAHDFDADLANNYTAEDWRRFVSRKIEPQPGDPQGPNGEIYSRHNMLLPLLLVPTYLVAGRWGAMVFITVCAAALAWMILRLARRGGASPSAALLAYAILAFSPPLLVYTYQIWIEIPAALMVIMAFDRIQLMRLGGRRKDVLVLVALLVLMPLMKLRLGLVALPLAALAVYRLRPPRSTVLLLLGSLLAAFGGILTYNQLRYGNLLKMHRLGELNLYASSLAEYARGGVGMFYDAAFGLFPSAPIWLLLIPGLWLLVRRTPGLQRSVDTLDLAVVTLPYLLTLWPRFEWYGAWSPPFRYPLVFLPLLALVLVPLLELRHRPGMRLLVSALAALTFILTVIWVVVPGWTYNFANGTTHLLDQAGARLNADVARLFPSTVRPRLATWIWPPMSLLLIPLALWRGRRWKRATSRRFHGSGAAWGVVIVLLFAASLPLLARHWPTRIIEVEDGWVKKRRGALFPDTWVLQRPRYVSGWVVPPRGRLLAPVAAGGESVRIRLDLGTVNPQRRACLHLAAGYQPLTTIDVPTDGWNQLDLGPFEWPSGQPLVLLGCGPEWPGRAAVDRLELTWQ